MGTPIRWLIPALLLFGAFLWLDGPSAEHSEATRSWAAIRCEQTTASAAGSAACQAVVADAHERCLGEAYRPGSRHRRSNIDRDHYWDCVAEAGSAVPPRPPTRRLVL